MAGLVLAMTPISPLRAEAVSSPKAQSMAAATILRRDARKALRLAQLRSAASSQHAAAAAITARAGRFNVRPSVRALREALGLEELDWQAYLKQIIMDGLQQGVFRDDLDPDSTATELIILLKGVTYHYTTSSRTIDFDLILKDVERLLLR